jgi:hypothetical protein
MTDDFAALELEARIECMEAAKVKQVGWATYGIFQVVGNGDITDDDPNSPKRCGKMYGFIGCVKTHLHDKATLDSVNHRGNAYIKKRIRHCL